MRYYLSADTQKDTGDRLLSPTRPVPALAPGASSTAPTSPPITLTIPNNVALGSYYLLACADDTTAVAETNETNNCLASASTVQVARPDLIESGLGEPPATAARGSSFAVTETVVNQGVVAAGASTTRYYLSTDGVAMTKRLNGTRAVEPLGPGASSPAPRPRRCRFRTTRCSGTYRLLACADDTTTVTEGAETNNCQASSGTIVVTP